MRKLTASLLFGFLLFCNLAFSAEEELISGEQLARLYQQGSPLHVSVVWRRPDGKFEAVSDFYDKSDARPIIKIELAQNCHVKSVIDALVNNPPYNMLKVSVTARAAGLGREEIGTFSLMDIDQLRYYGFLKQ